MKRLLIVGTGALATLFAWRLASSGLDVILWGTWQEALDAFNARGACVDGPDGTRRCAPVQAVAAPNIAPRIDTALVLVKSWQTERAAAWLEKVLSPQGVAVTLQNGLGNADVLAAALGAARTASGVTTLGAAIRAPGVVRWGGEGEVALQTHPRLDGLLSALRRAGFSVSQTERPQALMWRKLVVNTAINPLTALLDIPNGDLLRLPDAAALMAALARETAEVAARMGYPLEHPQELAREVAARTADNFSSMLQDVRRGAPTEIEAICGAVVRAGASCGLDTPLNAVFLRLIRARVAKAVK